MKIVISKFKNVVTMVTIGKFWLILEFRFLTNILNAHKTQLYRNSITFCFHILGVAIQSHLIVIENYGLRLMRFKKRRQFTRIFTVNLTPRSYRDNSQWNITPRWSLSRSIALETRNANSRQLELYMINNQIDLYDFYYRSESITFSEFS